MNTQQLLDAAEVGLAAYGQFNYAGAPIKENLVVLNGDPAGFADTQATRFGDRFRIALPTFNDATSPGGSGKTSFDVTVFSGIDTSPTSGNNTGARGRSLTTVITELNPILRGWMAYFKLTETKKVLEELDGWIRHKLRCILWRQWKRPYPRATNLMKAGLTEERAFRSAFNQRGPWWNSGASHMNQAFPKSFFVRLGLVSLLDTMRRLQCVQ